MLYKLGSVLIDQRGYKTTEDATRRLVESHGSRDSNGDDDVDTLKALYLLGRALGCQGLHMKAEGLHRRVLTGREGAWAGAPSHAHQRRQPCVGVVEPGQVRRGRSNAPARTGRKRGGAWTIAPRHAHQHGQSTKHAPSCRPWSLAASILIQSFCLKL